MVCERRDTKKSKGRERDKRERETRAQRERYQKRDQSDKGNILCYSITNLFFLSSLQKDIESVRKELDGKVSEIEKLSDENRQLQLRIDQMEGGDSDHVMAPAGGPPPPPPAAPPGPPPPPSMGQTGSKTKKEGRESV